MQPAILSCTFASHVGHNQINIDRAPFTFLAWTSSANKAASVWTLSSCNKWTVHRRRSTSDVSFFYVCRSWLACIYEQPQIGHKSITNLLSWPINQKHVTQNTIGRFLPFQDKRAKFWCQQELKDSQFFAYVFMGFLHWDWALILAY